MKMLVSTGPKATTLIDVEKPVLPGSRDMLVKVHYCGVCMSEHYAWSTAAPGRSYGHEGVGVVEVIGSDVTKFKVGDRVSGLLAGTGEYEILYEDYACKIPDHVTDEQAIIEPLMCLISAVSKVRLPTMGTRVAVVGCGYMGCGAISLLKLRGAYVVAVDIRPESLENAKRYGADEVYLPSELPENYTTDQSATEGFETVMEWGETEESLDLAIHMTSQCGQLCVGAYHTGGKRLVDVQLLNVRAIDMLSTHPREDYYNRKGIAEAIRLLDEGKWSFCNVPTKIWPITQFDQAHEELPNKFGKYLKSIVDWTKFDGEAYII